MVYIPKLSNRLILLDDWPDALSLKKKSISTKFAIREKLYFIELHLYFNAGLICFITALQPANHICDRADHVQD